MPSAKTVDSYTSGLNPEFKAIVAEVRKIIKEAAPNSTESIKWGQPVYEENGPFAHTKAFPQTINFGFWRGADIPDPKKLLGGAGDKMRYVRLTTMKDIDKKAFADFVKAAVELNKKLGDPTKKA